MSLYYERERDVWSVILITSMERTNGRMKMGYKEYDDYLPPESCYCHAVKMPPCSYCTREVDEYEALSDIEKWWIDVMEFELV